MDFQDPHPGKTVVEVTQILVDAPLVDGANAFITRLATFSTFEKAATFTGQKIRDYGPGDYGILYYELEMVVLDSATETAPTAIFSGDDKLRGFIPADMEAPWDGRSPADCWYRAGELVGVVLGDRYRVGIVLRPPPTPEDVARSRGLTLGDDLYLVALLSADEGSEGDDHHVPQPLLFPVEHDVAQVTRDALRRRFERYLEALSEWRRNRGR